MFQDGENDENEADEDVALRRSVRTLSRDISDLRDEDRYNSKSNSYWMNHDSWSITSESTISEALMLMRIYPKHWSRPTWSPPSPCLVMRRRKGWLPPSTRPSNLLASRRRWREWKVGAVLGWVFLLRQLVLLKKGWFESYICRQFLSTIQNGTCGGLTERYGPYGVTDQELKIWALCKTVSTFKQKCLVHSTYQSILLHNFSL